MKNEYPIGSGIKWFHRVRLSDGVYTPGVCFHGPDGGTWTNTRFGLPQDLNGKTVLDIGSHDGFFTFESERRGGMVDSVDYLTDNITFMAPKAYEYAHKQLSSKAKWHHVSIEDTKKLEELFPNKHDVVLFYGVLYHIRSPLTAMENVFNRVKEGGIVLVETTITTATGPILEYRPGFDNDATNRFYPSVEWMQLVGKWNKFKCEVIYNDGIRATFRYTKV